MIIIPVEGKSGIRDFFALQARKGGYCSSESRQIASMERRERGLFGMHAMGPGVG